MTDPREHPVTINPVAIDAADVAPRTGSGYPAPFAARVAQRVKRAIGDVFGLTSFGVNLTRLPPGTSSALRHAHTHEDEFVFVLEGAPTLITDAGETALQPGMCAGFARRYWQRASSGQPQRQRCRLS